MSEMLVWAFKPLPELTHKTGFVTCEKPLGKRLIAEGRVQDPAVGAHWFKEIERFDASTYETKVMTPKRRRSRAEVEDETPPVQDAG